MVLFTDVLHNLQNSLIVCSTARKLGRIPSSEFDEEKLPNLKCFSLCCNWIVNSYDELIVPFLRRMSNLEELDLDFLNSYEETFIDGNSLKKITDHMAQLNKFMFNIRSVISFDDEINLPSNEDIQYTFRDFKNNEIISCIDYFFKETKGECLMYSNPYTLIDYNNITNNFPGGLFKNVRRISLFDEHPFEHEFFLKIAQSFPFLNELDLKNYQQQKNKRCSK
ncbi:unnamed protein product [Rotaria sp. Silwood2]|nr:unnamed protein product [Rotaria sp. Silwood2]CAF4384800.1 unnamed protein product [Rotaria sp. Silwood2]